MARSLRWEDEYTGSLPSSPRSPSLPATFRHLAELCLSIAEEYQDFSIAREALVADPELPSYALAYEYGALEEIMQVCTNRRIWLGERMQKEVPPPPSTPPPTPTSEPPSTPTSSPMSPPKVIRRRLAKCCHPPAKFRLTTRREDRRERVIDTFKQRRLDVINSRRGLLVRG